MNVVSGALMEPQLAFYKIANVPHSALNSVCSSGGGQQTDPGARSWHRAAAVRAVPTQHTVGAESQTPHSLYARAAVPSGAGVHQGELRVQSPAL